MATLLRSAKHIRCLTSFIRRLAVSGKSITDSESQLRCMSSLPLRKNDRQGISSQMLAETNMEYDFIKLDQKVKQFGRIFKPDIEHLLRIVRSAEFLSSEHALMLIRCCGNLMPDELPNVKIQLVHEIWSTLEMLSTPLDVLHYNALLRVYIENDYTFSPTEFVTKMEEKSITPNIITYQRFITYYCSQGDIIGAAKILEKMKEIQMPVSESIFNALITGHSQAGNMENAIGVLNIMKQTGMEPSADTYTALMCAYAKIGDLESIEDTFKTCQSKKILFLDKDLMDVIYTLAANGHGEHVDKIFDLMVKGANYTFDAMHLILKLVDIGQEDVALKVLKSTLQNINEDNPNMSLPITFIKKLVKSNVPIEKTIQISKDMMKEGLSKSMFSSAVYSSYFENDENRTLALLSAWKEVGASIKEHYFWPLLVKQGNANNFHGILEVIQRMINTFQVVPDIETLTNFVIPYSVGSTNEITDTLLKYEIPIDSITNSLASYLLAENRTRQASYFIKRNVCSSMVENLYEPIISALEHTSDVQSFVNILLYLYKGTQSISNLQSNDLNTPEVSTELVDRYILGIMDLRNNIKKEVLHNLLDVKLSISKEVADELRKNMRIDNPEVDNILDILSSGTLIPKPSGASELFAFSAQNFDNWMKKVEELQSKGELTVEMKKNLLEFICSRKSVDYVERFLKELKAEDFDALPLLYKPIINFYIEMGKVDEVEKYLNELETKGFPVVLSDIKVIQFMSCLINMDRFDDAIKFLEKQPKQEKVLKNKSYEMLCRQLLNTVAQTGNVENLNTLFNNLNEKNYIYFSRIILIPLIHVHLLRNDMEKALQVFENICNSYNITPCKQDLMIKCIHAEDAISLQKITDLSIRVHGEHNSLQDLAIAFIYCGRARQARRILETPGLYIQPQKFILVFNQTVDMTKRANYFETFIDITKGMTRINRSILYEALMNIYNATDNWKKGSDLWLKMQEEEHLLKPSSKFTMSLTNLLQRNNQPVPLILPEVNKESYIEQFLNAIKKEDLQHAEKLLSRIKSYGVSSVVKNTSMLIKAFLNHNQLDEALTYTKYLFMEHNGNISKTVLRELLRKLALYKRTEDIAQLRTLLNSSTVEHKSSEKLVSIMYEISKDPEHFLNMLEMEITEQRESAADYENVFFINTMVQILEMYPDIAEKYENMFKEFVTKHSFYMPIRALWTYYFIQQNPKAGAIWTEYLEMYPHLSTQYITDYCKQNKNTEFLKKLLILAKDRSLLVQSRIYNALVDIQVDQGCYEEGMQTLRTAEKLFPSNLFSPTLIARLQKGLQQLDKTTELTDNNERAETINN